MTFEQNNFFYWEILSLKISGIPLKENTSFAYKVYSYVMMICASSYPVLLSVDLLTQNFNDVLDSWAMFIGSFFVTSVNLTTFLKRANIGRLLNKLNMEPFLPNVDRGGDAEKLLMQEWFRFKNIRLVVFSVGVVVVVVPHAIYSAIARFTNANSHEWTLRYGKISIIDTSYSPNFEIVWIYEVFTIFLYSFCTGGIILILSGVLDCVATQFRMLQNNMTVMLDNTKKKQQQSTVETPEWVRLNKSIQDIVIYHEDIIKIVSELEAIFSNSILSVFVGAFGFLCIEIYRSSMFPPQDVRATVILLEGSMVFSIAFLICNAAENLAHESGQVAVAAYGIDFVGMDIRFQKSLIIFIRKSQVPIRIKAGNLIELSRVTAARIIRASYSAYMMLKTTNAKNS